MGRILYIFPHPDDESFGPGPAMARQVRQGRHVALLTLTEGEATQQRHAHGYTLEEMGAVRRREMACVAAVLGLGDLTVLALPDGKLADEDPAALEAVIERHIRRQRPDVLVTYPAHGISGHPDHVATHAAVTRVFEQMRAAAPEAAPRRLAYFVLPPAADPAQAEARADHLQSSPEAAIGCITPVDAEDLALGARALACYETYQAVVEAHDPLAQVVEGVCFALRGEPAAPLRSDLLEGLA